MVAQSPPFALQNAQHSAALFRQALYSSWLSGGILAAGDLAVAAQSTPNMSVQVAAGRAWIPGTQMKAGKHHGIPLSRSAVAALRAARGLNPKGERAGCW